MLVKEKKKSLLKQTLKEPPKPRMLIPKPVPVVPKPVTTGGFNCTPAGVDPKFVQALVDTASSRHAPGTRVEFIFQRGDNKDVNLVMTTPVKEKKIQPKGATEAAENASIDAIIADATAQDALVESRKDGTPATKITHNKDGKLQDPLYLHSYSAV